MVVVFFFFFKQKTAYEMLRSLVGSEMCIRDSVWTPNAFFGGSMRRWVGGGGASSNDLRGTNANEAADNEVLSQWQDVASKGGYYAWTRDASLTSPDDNALSFTSVRSALDRIAKRDIDCLLYTSDAADEEDSVDLGGSRIIKKKKEERTAE
eukprot:TRINITY_DN62377_c0_g1_i1.p1 TRINITY_DN62377_c0_g1~~TRINITY_DN62377_c0_g1_i1.p1  ORF type:complete len:152 (-),score=57.21 TRINITY_DN62377_c0_g1_i1:57-512(-)